MNWFGKPYGAPYEADCAHVATPVGVACGWCDEAIAAGDDGLVIPHLGTDRLVSERPWHYACQLRSVVGGVRHQLRQCSCCGLGAGLPPDPEGLTRRQAADAAASLWALNIRKGDLWSR